MTRQLICVIRYRSCQYWRFWCHCLRQIPLLNRILRSHFSIIVQSARKSCSHHSLISLRLPGTSEGFYCDNNDSLKSSNINEGDSGGPVLHWTGTSYEQIAVNVGYRARGGERDILYNKVMNHCKWIKENGGLGKWVSAWMCERFSIAFSDSCRPPVILQEKDRKCFVADKLILSKYINYERQVSHSHSICGINCRKWMYA